MPYRFLNSILVSISFQRFWFARLFARLGQTGCDIPAPMAPTTGQKRPIVKSEGGSKSSKKSRSNSFTDAVNAGIPADMVELPYMMMMKQWMQLNVHSTCTVNFSLVIGNRHHYDV